MAGARLAVAAAFVLAGLGRVAAGDFADREIFGFSPDGGTFAFEEFGVQDGSGFPYATIYVIDTAKDAWVSGTPIRVRIDDETVTVKPFEAAATGGIGMAVAMRDLKQHLRETGEIKGYNPGFSARDRSAFLSALDQLVRRSLRTAGN